MKKAIILLALMGLWGCNEGNPGIAVGDCLNYSVKPLEAWEQPIIVRVTELGVYQYRHQYWYKDGKTWGHSMFSDAYSTISFMGYKKVTCPDEVKP